MKYAFVTLCSRYILFAMTMEILQNQVSDDSHVVALPKNYLLSKSERFFTKMAVLF